MSPLSQRSDSKPISLSPIGIVHSTRKMPEDDNWDAEKTTIELHSDKFSEQAFLALSQFSHVEVVFYMDHQEPSKIEKAARRPRGNPAWPLVGIFAQRGKNRPNQIGITICRIVRVTGLSLELEGLDAIDGTQVLDIKPWVEEFGPRGARFQPVWMTELMREYWHR